MFVAQQVTRRSQRSRSSAPPRPERRGGAVQRGRPASAAAVLPLVERARRSRRRRPPTAGDRAEQARGRPASMPSRSLRDGIRLEVRGRLSPACPGSAVLLAPTYRSPSDSPCRPAASPCRHPRRAPSDGRQCGPPSITGMPSGSRAAAGLAERRSPGAHRRRRRREWCRSSRGRPPSRHPRPHRPAPGGARGDPAITSCWSN